MRPYIETETETERDRQKDRQADRKTDIQTEVGGDSSLFGIINIRIYN